MFNEWILIRFNPLFPGVSWRDGLKSCRTVSYWNLSEFNLSQIWPWLFPVLWRVRGYPKSLRNWRDLEARFHSVHLRTHTLTYVFLHLHMYLIVFTCTIPEVYLFDFFIYSMSFECTLSVMGETDLLRSEVAELSGLEFEGGSCFFESFYPHSISFSIYLRFPCSLRFSTSFDC